MLEECHVVGDSEFLILKQLLARKLISKGFTQVDISRILKITQPMVSNYLKSNVNNKELSQYAENLANSIDRGGNIDFAVSISSNKVPFGKYYLASKENIISKEKLEVINDLIKATHELKNINLSEVLPQVKINLAMGKYNFKKKEDIAAFGGGLIFVRGVLQNNTDPDFGISNHLSGILLQVNKVDSSIRAIINLKYNNTVKNAITKNMFKSCKLQQIKRGVEIIIDFGGFGIEPCAYIIGENASSVVRSLKALI